MVFDEGLKNEGKTTGAESLGALFSKEDIETKARVDDAYNETVFEFVGFDMLPEDSQKKILNDLYKRPATEPVTVGDYFFAFAHLHKLNSIPEGGEARREYVAMGIGVQQQEREAESKVLKGIISS